MTARGRKEETARKHRPSAGPRPLSLISSRSQLSKAAQLYYVEKISQHQIAKRMNVSVASVSRALTKARSMGIVRISIHSDTDDFSKLEIAVEQAFGLRECLLVPGTEQVEHLYGSMSQALAELLGRILRRGDSLGLSWGETLKAVSERMPAVPIREVKVIPVVGALGKIDTGIYPSSLARTFAEKVGGTAYLINTPAMVGSESIRRSLMSEASFQQVRDMWRRLDVVLLSAGGLGRDSSLYRTSLFGAEELESFQAAGAVAACNFILFDEQGRQVHADLMDRLVKLSLPDLQGVEHRVLLVAGSPAKVDAVRAVLRSNLVSTLITDVKTARALLPGPGAARVAAAH